VKGTSLTDELYVSVSNDARPRREVRCIECGYGAVSAGPLRCPMCGGDAWDFVEWRPFQRDRA
jgi:rubrerythrin